MADKTRISWTEATWNPVTGCTRVSPACDHCYWTDVNQRPVPRSALADEALCRYLGRLPEDEARALGSFWATTLMLGRKNF